MWLKMNTIVIFYMMGCLMKSKNEVLIKFGERVRKVRKERVLSQEELAHKAHLHRTYIGMVERAEKNITLININKIANALGVSIYELMDSI